MVIFEFERFYEIYLFIYFIYFIYFASPGSYVYIYKKNIDDNYKTRQGHHNSKNQLLWAQILKNGSIDFFKTLNTRACRCDQF